MRNMLNSLVTVTKCILSLMPKVTNSYAASININQFKTAVIWPIRILPYRKKAVVIASR